MTTQPTLNRPLTTDELKTAREWLEDCGADVSGRSNHEITRAIARHYHSGLGGFVIESADNWDAAVYAE